MSIPSQRPSRPPPIRHKGISPYALGVFILIVLIVQLLSGRFSSRQTPMPSFEEALTSPDSLAAVCRSWRQPEPPDLKGLDPEAARAIYEAIAALAARPTAASIGRLGMVYHAHDLLGQAVAAYERAQQLDPEDYAWPYYLGYIASGRNETQNAIEAFKRSCRLRPDYSPTYLHLGDLYLDSGQYDLARQCFQSYADRRPQDALGYSGLGRLAHARGDDQAAVPLLEKAVQLDPADYRAYFMLGQIYLDQGRTELGQQLRATAAELPKQVALHDQVWFEMTALSTSLAADLDRFESAMREGNHSAAFKLAQRIVARAPKDHVGWLHLTQAARAVDRPEEAEKAARQAIELKPELPDGYTLLALLYLDASGKAPEKLAMAQEQADKAVALDARYAPAHAVRSQIYEDLHRPDEALRCLREATRLQPSNADYWRELSRFLTYVSPDLPEALKAVDKYLELRPGDPAARKHREELVLRISTGTMPAVSQPPSESGFNILEQPG